jgi:hypothetical protein
MIREIFQELIKEASTGKVIIDNEEWPIAFNTKIFTGNEVKCNYENEKNNACLIIKNEESFYNLLEKYINEELKYNRKTCRIYSDVEKNKIKWIMSYLFVNSTTEDFLEPNRLLERRIDFLHDQTFNILDEELEIENSIKSLKDSKLIIKKETCPVSMETPYKIDIKIKSPEGVECQLPSVYYGISNNTCYIYSILNENTKKKMTPEEEKFSKKINRLLYKLNDKVQENEMPEYYEYKNNESTYYPEGNISDITTSFLLSVNIFTSLLESKKIDTIKVVPYLPLRYNSRKITAEEITAEERKKELLERNNTIQNNATNKLIRTFRRLAFHNSNLDIYSLPYEVDEYLTIHLSNTNKLINNMLLEETSSNVSRELDNKKI